MHGWRTPILASFLMTFGFVGYLVIYQHDQSETGVSSKVKQPVLESVKQSRNVTPDEILQAPELQETLLERLPAVEPPPLPPKPVEPDRFQKPQVVESGKLKIGERTITLADIKPISLDHLCTTQSGKEWPCGRFARTEMRKFIRGRTIECDPVDEKNEAFTTRCRLASFDISAWLVMTGWAEPKGELFKEELAIAKQSERGIWRKSAP